jgi:hypothetical protein
MSSFDKRTTSAVHPNAFNPLFLRRLGERDEPPTAGEADVAGRKGLGLPFRLVISRAFRSNCCGRLSTRISKRFSISSNASRS